MEALIRYLVSWQQRLDQTADDPVASESSRQAAMWQSAAVTGTLGWIGTHGRTGA